MEALEAALGVAIESIAAWFFCCVMAVFVLPVILDRMVFYVPMLIRLSKDGEVYPRSVRNTVLEIVLWVAVITLVYTYLYFFQHNLFDLVTRSIPAYIAWGIGGTHIVYRVFNFDRIIKRSFYYTAYMRYITPESLRVYHQFIEDLDSLYIDDLEGLLQKRLPYMHRQAALRKQREVTRGGKSVYTPTLNG